MKLNPDCVRAVLMEIERIQVVDAETGLLSEVNLADIVESEGLEAEFLCEDIVYSVKQLSDCKFIDAESTRTLSSTGFIIWDITPIGHEFLANIRGDTIWTITKSKAAKLGISSLSGLGQIAVQVVAECIKQQIFPG